MNESFLNRRSQRRVFHDTVTAMNTAGQENMLTSDIIGAAIEVHRFFGPGLLESVYEKSLIRELELRGHSVRQQSKVQITYKDFTFEENLRSDLIVNEVILIENKAVEKLLPIHKAQVLNYMKLLKLRTGLLFNFHAEKLTDGLHRLSL